MTDRRHSRGWRYRLRWAVGRRTTDLLGRVDRVFGQSRMGAHIRNFWLLVITGVSCLAIIGNYNTLHTQTRGRHFAIAVICAFGNAGEEAGRSVLAASGQMPETRFTRNLERLGYPPFPVRRRQGNTAASEYVKSISTRVQRQVGRRVPGLIRPDGTLSCERLQRLADTASR